MQVIATIGRDIAKSVFQVAMLAKGERYEEPLALAA
jgi:hypothetical protein